MAHDEQRLLVSVVLSVVGVVELVEEIQQGGIVFNDNANLLLWRNVAVAEDTYHLGRGEVEMG